MVHLHYLSSVFCPAINKFTNKHGGKASHTSEPYSAQRLSTSSCTLSVFQTNIATHAKKTHLSLGFRSTYLTIVAFNMTLSTFR